MALSSATYTDFYELPPTASEDSVRKAADMGAPRSLPEPLLVENALWFCRLRWMVVAAMAVLGTLSYFPGIAGRINLCPRIVWPFVVGGILAVCNAAFLAHAKLFLWPSLLHRGKANLWSQIVLDLLVLTAVVHCVGSLSTPIPFAYLFHIVLACIFFSRAESLGVTALACGLYAGCVWVEAVGMLRPGHIHDSAALREGIEAVPGMVLLRVASVLFIWLGVWYLASRLSAMVRVRDRDLAKSNRRLILAQEERAKHMLRTTHELKAPFAAIHANAQLLSDGYCGALSDKALNVVLRIAARCRRLSAEIKEMLIAQAGVMAEESDVASEQDIRPALVAGVEDHLKMLLFNVLNNAATYSHEGGRVWVRCVTEEDGPEVIIEDQGIGISPEKLPRIFEEYYHTNAAVRHNPGSTGLGLAIVRHVADTHGIRMRVDSAVGVGTRFTLKFPAPQGTTVQERERSAYDGIRVSGG